MSSTSSTTEEEKNTLEEPVDETNVLTSEKYQYQSETMMKVTELEAVMHMFPDEYLPIVEGLVNRKKGQITRMPCVSKDVDNSSTEEV